MTYKLEIQIEELRAELRNAVDGAERREIETELESPRQNWPSRPPRCLASQKPSRLFEPGDVRKASSD
jgi:hypothetical protein